MIVKLVTHPIFETKTSRRLTNIIILLYNAVILFHCLFCSLRVKKCRRPSMF